MEEEYVKPMNGTYWYHRYGGIYQVMDVGTVTLDGETQMVAYYHLFPFESQMWLRPLEEWTEERFVQISPELAKLIMGGDQETYKKFVETNKAAKKK